MSNVQVIDHKGLSGLEILFIEVGTNVLQSREHNRRLIY